MNIHYLQEHDGLDASLLARQARPRNQSHARFRLSDRLFQEEQERQRADYSEEDAHDSGTRRTHLRSVCEHLLRASALPSANGIKTFLESLVKQNPKTKAAHANTFVDASILNSLADSGFIKTLYE